MTVVDSLILVAYELLPEAKKIRLAVDSASPGLTTVEIVITWQDGDTSVEMIGYEEPGERLLTWVTNLIRKQSEIEEAYDSEREAAPRA